MRRDWMNVALVGGAIAALVGGFLLTRAAFGLTPGSSMMGGGHGMMMGSAPGWMQQMHNSMMGGGGPESLPDAPARPGAPVSKQSVSIREWSMNPGTLQVKAGSRLILTVRNEGVMAHNFAIPDLGVRLVNIPGGESRTVELNAEKAGTYTFLCDIAGHAQAGQQGVLTITN